MRPLSISLGRIALEDSLAVMKVDVLCKYNHDIMRHLYIIYKYDFEKYSNVSTPPDPPMDCLS